jgi:probable HAF family extracellular repeat protein
VGESQTADGNRAFLYTPATGIVDLNSLVDLPAEWALESALDINDAGQITGYGNSGGSFERPFLLTPIPEPHTTLLTTIAVSQHAMLRMRRKQRSRYIA